MTGKKKRPLVAEYIGRCSNCGNVFLPGERIYRVEHIAYKLDGKTMPVMDSWNHADECHKLRKELEEHRSNRIYERYFGKKPPKGTSWEAPAEKLGKM